MQRILLPQHDDTDRPEGMIHATTTPCPFEGLDHPRGSTCCSLDATLAQEGCRRYGGAPFAKLMDRDLSDKEAYGLGILLRNAYINMVGFHRWCAQRTDTPSTHPSVTVDEEARACGEAFPNWSFEASAEMVESVGKASEWLIRIGELHHGVRVTGVPSERE